jgi:hypothetical protein
MFIQHNTLSSLENQAINYIVKYRDNGTVEDLEKAIRYLQILLKNETRRENQTGGETGPILKEADRHL